MLQTLIQDPLSGLILMVYMLPGLLIGLTVHEWAHAAVDYHLGNDSQKFTGRLSLNPLRHIDWGGFLMFLILGFGWAKPVMSNALYYKNRRTGRILVSLAGIAANTMVCFVLAPIYLSLYTGTSLAQQLASEIIYYTLYTNAMLAALNILPLPPLDGSKIARELIPGGGSLWMRMDQYGIFVLIVLSFTGILGTVISFLRTYMMNGIFYFWGLFF